MNEWTAIVEQAIQRCKEAETQARKERKVWETLKKRLPEAETRPFAILSSLINSAPSTAPICPN